MESRGETVGRAAAIPASAREEEEEGECIHHPFGARAPRTPEGSAVVAGGGRELFVEGPGPRSPWRTGRGR